MKVWFAALLAAVACAPALATAAHEEVARHLGSWQPADVDAASWKPDFVVAADGSGTHRSVQAAVDAVPARADGDTRTWTIRIRPGTWRGPLCVKDKAPLRLVGEPGDVRAVVLADGRYHALPKAADAPAHPCLPVQPTRVHGTSGSATAVLASADVLLAHLTIANDARPSTDEGAQAVALLTLADRIQLEDVRLLSNQDTFYVRRPARDVLARVFVRGSVIEGDVDFVFGNATLVVDDSTLVSRSGRRRGGIVLAPSTPPDTALGFLVLRSRFVADGDLPAGSVSLGRAWDEGVAKGAWQAGTSPDGHAVVRDSAFGPHIGGWAASTSGRAAVPQRLLQAGNTTLPADIARETLPPGDGWGGGTRGGADAAPQDVHVVRNRAELVAALRPHDRPRIVKVQGRIDLSTADDGRPLGADDYRDPAFSWPAFAAAYDPATWGRKPPEGPLEDARRASAAAQAARVVIAVPSRTTIIGWGPDAAIINGGLALIGVQDIIVRNLRISDAYDHFPAWDPKHNGHGEWNSEYDTITLRRAERVWVDHCTLDDGDRPDAAEPQLLGRPLQRHDGLLDITRASSFVTVSWTHLRDHDKTSLVGGSDRHAEDEGRLKVTYHHNRWQQTKERSPRVRFGQVHVYNNLYEVRQAAAFGYSIGVGHRSAIVSQHNAWQVPAGLPPARLVRVLGGDAFEDHGSLVDGQPLPPAGLKPAGWQPAPGPAIDPARLVPARVRAGAGAGRLWTPP